jgi:pimeloyl-ACP methyl ester carboxylesterase
MKKYIPAIIGSVSQIFPALASQMALRVFARPVRIPRPESEMLWYNQSKKYFLKSGIAAFEWGDADRPLVMLIHGWNGRGTQIASFAPMLVENGFRVVALDGPGHGISPGKMTNPSHFAKFIEDSQNELDGRGAHAVIAHSFGGGCTVLAASRGLKTKKIILIASPAFYERVVHFFAQSMKLSEKSEKLFVELVAKVAGIHPKELNIGAIGSRLDLPVMIVHDEQDNAVNFLSATAIAEAWPHSVLLKTNGLGHRRILRDPEVIKAVCDFISQRD